MGILSGIVATVVGEVVKPVLTPVIDKGKEFVDHVKADMKAIEERKKHQPDQKTNPNGWTDEEMERAKALIAAERRK